MLVRKSKYNTTRGRYDFPGRRICFFKYKRKNNFKLKSVVQGRIANRKLRGNILIC